ncbi:hypothetical protein ACQJBY_048832 [Aegilops geniculata]
MARLVVSSMAAATECHLSGQGSIKRDIIINPSEGHRCRMLLHGNMCRYTDWASSNSVLAQDDLVAPAATSEQADVNVTGLHRIEDDLVISNDHTIKW